MKENKVNILNVMFDSLTKEQLLRNLTKRVGEKSKTFLVTANPEIVMHANENPEYMQMVKNADFVIADGIGIIIGSKVIGQPLPERIPGFELLQELLKIGNDSNWSAYFLGAKREVVEKAVENVRMQYPCLQIAGHHDGYFDLDSTYIQEEIRKTKPDLIFVALGVPRQEKFISSNLPIFEKGLFIGVGGSFDVLAGAVKRAPVIWQKLNLEWLYRLIKQPSRWRRMLALPIFMVHMIQKRLKS